MTLPIEDKFTQHPLGDAGPARHAARRPRGRGARLPRADHRRRQRHREGHRIARGDGHRVRHERAARRASSSAAATPRPSSAATWATSATTPRRSPPTIDEEVRRAHRGRARRGVGDPGRVPRRARQPGAGAMEKETLSRTEVLEIFAAGRSKRPRRGSYTGYGKRLPSDRPPVLTPKELALDGSEHGGWSARQRHGASRERQRSAAPSDAGPGTRMTQVRASTGSAWTRRVRPARGSRRPSARSCIAIGEDPDRDGLRDTPARVARAYAEQFAGLRQTPEDVLDHGLRRRPRRDGARQGHRGLLDLRAPPGARSTASPTSATSPNAKGQITGLSKLARLVDVYARRPQVQERMTCRSPTR